MWPFYTEPWKWRLTILSPIVSEAFLLAAGLSIRPVKVKSLIVLCQPFVFMRNFTTTKISVMFAFLVAWIISEGAVPTEWSCFHQYVETSPASHTMVAVEQSNPRWLRRADYHNVWTHNLFLLRGNWRLIKRYVVEQVMPKTTWGFGD